MGQAICHLEINVSDLDRASNFYRELLGWEISRWGEQPYAMFKSADGSLGGGLSAFGCPSGPGGVTYYVQVDEFESYFDKAKTLGGTTDGNIHHIDDNIGDCAFVNDPDGNPVGLFKPVG